MMSEHVHAHTNRLIDETSPYLLQHAHNPVEWFPWCDEAFEKARSENKPLLVSIGYSACHWCHVMEHESFEDEATAAVMNENFVNIKVDMEERPDVDQIYMNFVQITTGRGGWPMNVFITPDKRPFFGGTYFPPSPRYGMPSWTQILMSIADAYRDRRDEIENTANEIIGELRRMTVSTPSGGGLTRELLDSAFRSFERAFDTTNGGFGGAPKFPQAMSLEFLLRYHHRTGDERPLQLATHTLDKMAAGGMYDQLGGGFHRYSVDAGWLVPHFEKMLYDNAQLARVYLHAFQVTRSEDHKAVTREILDYVRREMLDESDAFYSTQDADSEGVEGKFFVWTTDEVTELLGERDARIFNFYYNISKDGNFEGHNILNRNYSVDATAAALKVGVADVLDVIIRGREILFNAREKRVKPGRDEKVLTAWNGLMLAAFADAAAVLNDRVYLETAVNNAEFIFRELYHDGRLLRTWKNGRSKLNAYIEDYANVADGLLVLFQATGDVRWLVKAKELADTMITEFWDDENGGFFFTSNDHETLIVRNKDFYDNATPSGNSAAADVLLRLAKLTGDNRYERFAVTVLRIAATQLTRHPQGFGRTLSALEFHLADTKEIVIVGDGQSELFRSAAEAYLPNAILARTDDPVTDSQVVPLFEGRAQLDGNATAYVCENFVCMRPTADTYEMMKMIGK